MIFILSRDTVPLNCVLKIVVAFLAVISHCKLIIGELTCCLPFFQVINKDEIERRGNWWKLENIFPTLKPTLLLNFQRDYKSPGHLINTLNKAPEFSIPTVKHKAFQRQWGLKPTKYIWVSFIWCGETSSTLKSQWRKSYPGSTFSYWPRIGWELHIRNPPPIPPTHPCLI